MGMIHMAGLWSSMLKSSVAAAAGLSMVSVDVAAQAISFGSPLAIDGKFTAPATDADKKHEKARGLSGIGCLGNDSDSSRECLVVNDEETFAEVATLTPLGLKPTGNVLAIVAQNENGKGVVGTERVAPCPERDDKFSELDGEGISIAPNYVYIISSHSCSSKGKYKPSSYLISRFRTVGADKFQSPPASIVIERTWRGADMLVMSDVGSAFGAPKETGTNIEGVAVIGPDLYAGLRTPTVGSGAVLIKAPTDALFTPGKDPLAKDTVATRTLNLGKNSGIRDLARLSDDSLLILSGPTLEQPDVEYTVWHLPKPIWTSEPSARLIVKTNAKAKKPEETPKAEAMAVLAESGSKVVVVIAYDNVDEAAPTKHEVELAR
ncbi:hypothetical protein ACVIW2_000043 [Bradyrhizobium huanghuaihaiense]